jgi:outer membrane biosynthesis protein TonB
MEIYMGIAVSHAAAGLFALAVGVVAGSEAAYAQANVLKECGSQYQAAKAANELGGQSWQDFLKACRARLAEEAKPAEEKPAEAAPAEAKPAEAKPETPPPAAAEAPPPAAAPQPATESKPAESPPATEAKPVEPPPATEAAPAPKPAADTKAAMRARQKKCAAEWKTKKAEFKKSGSKMTWPKYWSECNKRLKAAGE